MEIRAGVYIKEDGRFLTFGKELMGVSGGEGSVAAGEQKCSNTRRSC